LDVCIEFSVKKVGDAANSLFSACTCLHMGRNLVWVCDGGWDVSFGLEAFFAGQHQSLIHRFVGCPMYQKVTQRLISN